MSKNSASAGRVFATDARRSHGRDDRYRTGRYFWIRLWRFSKFRDRLGHANNGQQAQKNAGRARQARGALRRIHQRMLEASDGFTRAKSRQAGNVVVDLRVAQPHPALRVRRSAHASGRAREIHHGTILRAECFDRRISRTRSQAAGSIRSRDSAKPAGRS